MSTLIDLEGCLIQVEASRAWFHQRVLPLSIEQLRWRPDTRQWSIAECLDHLNLTLDLYLPKIDDAIGRGGCRDRTSADCPECERAEFDALQLFEPPVTVRVSAPPPTIPGPAVDPDWLVDQFHLDSRSLLGCGAPRLWAGSVAHPDHPADLPGRH